MRDENAFARALLRVNQQNETTIWCNFPVRRCSNPYVLASNRDNTTMFAIMSVSSLFLLCECLQPTTLGRWTCSKCCCDVFRVWLFRFDWKWLQITKTTQRWNTITHPKPLTFWENMKIRWWLTTWKWSSSRQSKSFFPSHDAKIKQNFEITRSVCYFEFDQALSDEEEWRSWWFMQTQISSSQKKKKTNTNSDDDFQAVR